MSAGAPGAAPDADSQAVLDHWFGAAGSIEDGSVRKMWFTKSEATDREIAERFDSSIERALRGELAWAATPAGALAEILLLDQFTRNAFRDTPRAFAGDRHALRAASAMVGTRQDDALPPVQRAFVYMPFEHAESLALQDEAVRLFTRLAIEEPLLVGMLDHADRHRAVIARFGRFPHRNAILGRQSSAEEIAFLEEPGSRF